MKAYGEEFTDLTQASVNRHDKREVSVSEIAIIDSRSCIREAIAESIRGNSQRRVITAESAAALSNSSFCVFPTLELMILLCDGALDRNLLEDEVQSLRSHFVDAKLVLLTDHRSGNMMSVMREDLLDSVIPSHYNTRQLLACIQVIEAGISYLPSTFFQTNGVGDTRGNALEGSQSTQDQSSELSDLLTPRQREVMEYISRGRSNKYIAAELSVSESTVKVHVHEVMKRLGATSRTHASYLMNCSMSGLNGEREV